MEWLYRLLLHLKTKESRARARAEDAIVSLLDASLSLASLFSLPRAHGSRRSLIPCRNGKEDAAQPSQKRPRFFVSSSAVKPFFHSRPSIFFCPPTSTSSFGEKRKGKRKKGTSTIMAEKSSVTRAQAEAHRRALAALLKLDANRRCAECGGRGPTWASVNLGVFVCLNCSGEFSPLPLPPFLFLLPLPPLLLLLPAPRDRQSEQGTYLDYHPFFSTETNFNNNDDDDNNNRCPPLAGHAHLESEVRDARYVAPCPGRLRCEDGQRSRSLVLGGGASDRVREAR